MVSVVIALFPCSADVCWDVWLRIGLDSYDHLPPPRIGYTVWSAMVWNVGSWPQQLASHKEEREDGEEVVECLGGLGLERPPELLLREEHGCQRVDIQRRYMNSGRCEERRARGDRRD